MSILDRSQRVPFDRGSVVASVLDGPERIRLTVEARCAAADAAARVLAASPGWASSSDVIGYAERIEAWILREAEQQPPG